MMGGGTEQISSDEARQLYETPYDYTEAQLEIEALEQRNKKRDERAKIEDALEARSKEE